MNIEVLIGEAGSIEVNKAELEKHPAVMDYIWNYGLRQMLNDVHAGETAKKTPDSETRKANKRALVEKKLASLLAGEVAQARLGGDPVEKEMRAMAEADLKAKLRSLGKKVGDYDNKVWAEVVGKQVAKNAEAYRKAAEAKLAIKPEGLKSADADDILAMLG